MTKEELKQKCIERARIFQQAMKSCHTTNPMDFIEWFADRIAELEKENRLLGERCNQLLADKGKLTDENTELKAQLTALSMNKQYYC